MRHLCEEHAVEHADALLSLREPGASWWVDREHSPARPSEDKAKGETGAAPSPPLVSALTILFYSSWRDWVSGREHGVWRLVKEPQHDSNKTMPMA